MVRKNIYVKLLEEGVNTYRPASALEISPGIYRIEGFDGYDPEDEIWEFPPGSLVSIEERLLGGEVVLVGVAPNK